MEGEGTSPGVPVPPAGWTASVVSETFWRVRGPILVEMLTGWVHTSLQVDSAIVAVQADLTVWT